MSTVNEEENIVFLIRPTQISSTRGRQSATQHGLGGCGVVGISLAKTLILKEKNDQDVMQKPKHFTETVR